MSSTAGFSLIELLVVIAIVGVLSALAVPVYNSYSIRTKVASQIPILQIIGRDALQVYQRTGSFPDSITVNNITVPAYQWTTVDFGNIKSIAYEKTPSSGGASIILSVNLTGLDGISGYISPTSDTPTSNGRAVLTYALKDLGTSGIQSACGQYFSAVPDQFVPVGYLPASCSCTDVFTFYNAGVRLPNCT